MTLQYRILEEQVRDLSGRLAALTGSQSPEGIAVSSIPAVANGMTELIMVLNHTKRFLYEQMLLSRSEARREQFETQLTLIEDTLRTHDRYFRSARADRGSQDPPGP